MDKNPLITVVIPTFKRPKLLKRAIQSVLNQTYPHFKICVHDDASGDDTGKIVAEMSRNDSRILYFCNPQNLGIVKNSSQAYKLVDTPYFIELCDDNMLLPNCLENALNGFRKYPEAMFSAVQTIFVNKNRQILRVTLKENCREGLYEPPEGLLFLIKENPNILAGTLFRSEVKEKVGDYDVETGLVADSDYVYRISVQFPYVINKNPGAIWFYGDETSASFNSRSQFFWPQWLKLYQTIVGHPNLDLETKNEVDTHLKMRLKRMLVGQGKEAIRCGQYSVAEMSAQVLKDFFKSPRLCLKLRLFAFSCRWFPPYRWYLILFNELRAKKKRSEIKDRFSEYQKYATYMSD